MQTIGSFKLHKGGVEGIEITSEQLSKSVDKGNDEIYQDSVNTYRKKETPEVIVSATQRLKYYFLRMTGHWMDLYNAYIDEKTKVVLPVPKDNPKKGHIHLKSLFQSVEITQVVYERSKFTIRGTIEVIDDTKLALNPPYLSTESDVDWYGDAEEMIKTIFRLLFQYFSTIPLRTAEDYRKYLLSQADEASKQNIATFSKEDIVNSVMDKMANSGALIMIDEEIKQQMLAEPEVKGPDAPLEHEPEPDPSPEPDAVKGPGDDPVMDAVNNDSTSEWTPPVEKAPEPFGKPEATTDPVEPVSEAQEYSEAIPESDPEPVEENKEVGSLPEEDWS